MKSRPSQMQNQNSKKNPLVLEVMESRRLLSALATGVDADGDGYQIKLTGEGSLVSADLGNLILVDTNSASNLTITVTAVGEHGDGRVDVGSISTSTANLGKLAVQGNLGGLEAGSVRRITAQSIGMAEGDSLVFVMDGDVRSITVPGGILGASFTIAGDLGQLTVGNKKDTGSASTSISSSTFAIDGNLGRVRVNQSLTDQSVIEAGGDIGQILIKKSMINSTVRAGGDIQLLQVDGSIYSMAQVGEDGSMTLEAGGDVKKIQVKKNIGDAIVNISGDLGLLKTGEDLLNIKLWTSNLHNGLIGDDLNGSVFDIGQRVGKLQAREVSGLTLRVSETLGSFLVKEDVTGSMLSVFSRLDKVKIGGDLHRSLILGGVDIGPDWLHNTADDTDTGEIWIDQVSVGKDMTDTSIVAGIKANGEYFGDGDDTRTGQDGKGTARIHKINVKGQISSSGVAGESYAIMAEDGIDWLRSGGKPFTGAPGVLVDIL